MIFYTLQLSKLLQSKQQYVSNALPDVTQIKNALQCIWEDADNSLKKNIGKLLKIIASVVNDEIKILGRYL